MTSNKTKEDVSCTGDEEEKRPLEDPSGGENTSDATKCGEASSKQPPAYGENTAKKEAKTTMTAQASDEKKDDVKSASGAEQRKIKRTLRGFYTINKYIQSPKANMNDLQTLHAICYDRIGTPSKVKNNLRKFDGFEFSADSDEYKKRLNATQNISIGTLKGLCEGLNLNSEGTKEQLAAGIIKFLLALEEEEGEEEEPLMTRMTDKKKEEDDKDEDSQYEPMAKLAKTAMNILKS